MRYIPKSSEVLQALQDSIGKQIAEREEQKKNYVPTPVEIKPDKRDFLSIKNTVCEYYYSKSKLVFAFAYQKKGRKVKEYRAYYMGGKCYRYIGPDKKVHTYGSGKSYGRMSGMAKKLYQKGNHNIQLAYETNEPIGNK